MSRYTHGPGSSFSGAVGAGESPAQRLAVVDETGLGRSAPPSFGGQRDGPQSRRSRAPPQRVRRKAQPDIEGIETRTRYRPYSIPGRKAQPDIEGIETSLLASWLCWPACRKAQPDIEGIETIPLSAYAAVPVLSQSPARYRGHRNANSLRLTRPSQPVAK